ncbi:hypothetical protein P4C99_08175 [Pontiellaceae bacterium B1224]|nr:hypothetical protein [Pontiellaceae bacterium B1224]
MKITVALVPMLIAVAGCQNFNSSESSDSEQSAVSFMEKYDFNHDGLVSMEEFDGGFKSFVEMDLNRDTFIAASEVTEL